MKRADTVRQAAALLFTAEESVFTALRDVSVLTAGLIDQRRELGASAIVGQGAFDQLAQTAISLHAGRTSIVAVHAELAEVKIAVGAGRVVLNGGGDKSDSSPSTMEAMPQLRVVA